MKINTVIDRTAGIQETVEIKGKLYLSLGTTEKGRRVLEIDPALIDKHPPELGHDVQEFYNGVLSFANVEIIPNEGDE